MAFWDRELEVVSVFSSLLLLMFVSVTCFGCAESTVLRKGLSVFGRGISVWLLFQFLF